MSRPLLFYRWYFKCIIYMSEINTHSLNRIANMLQELIIFSIIRHQHRPPPHTFCCFFLACVCLHELNCYISIYIHCSLLHLLQAFLSHFLYLSHSLALPFASPSLCIHLSRVFILFLFGKLN